MLAPFESQPMRLSLENTSNSRAIFHLLGDYARQAGVEVQAQVLNPRKLRVIAESVTKCDRLDAAVLAELTRSDFKLPAVYLPDDEEFALREHLRARHDLVRLRTHIKNRVHAALHRRGILRPLRGSLFTGPGRAFLAKLELDEAGRVILDRYLNVYEHLEQQLTQSTEWLRRLARRPRWMKPAALLQTMPGVGLITSLTLLAELGDVRRFTSRAAVAHYAGLVPILRSSNDKEHRGGISKRGSAHLRRVLVEAAWTAHGRVERYHGLFSRIAARRNTKTAAVAVARRMLEDSWIMLMKDEAFRYASSVTG